MLIELDTSSILTRSESTNLFELPKELDKTIINLSNVNYIYLNKKYATVYLVSGHNFYTTVEGYEKIKTAGQPIYIVPFSSEIKNNLLDLPLFLNKLFKKRPITFYFSLNLF